jgi:hypothetical protein
MLNIDKRFWDRTLKSLLIGTAGSIIANYFIKWEGPSWDLIVETTKEVFSEHNFRTLILVGLMISIISVSYYWVRSFFTYLNKLFVAIKETGWTLLNEPLLDCAREEHYDSSCQSIIDKILQMCVTIPALKTKIKKRDPNKMWAGIFFRKKNDCLVLNNLYDPWHISNVKIGEIINGTRLSRITLIHPPGDHFNSPLCG